MSSDVPALYRVAIEKIRRSSDPKIERLRKSIALGDIRGVDAEPLAIADFAGEAENWGAAAFSELRSTGFICASVANFAWYRPSVAELTDDLAVLAGIESTAIIRLSALNCTGALAEISARLEDLRQAAATKSSITFLLAHQKLMLAVVASSNEEQLFKEFAGRATVATVYARAAYDGTMDFAKVYGAAEAMVNLLCAPGSRQCAALAADMRLQSPITLAAA